MSFPKILGVAGSLYLLVLPPVQSSHHPLGGPEIDAGSFSFGARAAYFRPFDADTGNWYGGAQLRLHVSRVWALEGSVDYRQTTLEDSRLDVFPVQGSLMVFLTPGYRISPFLLAGGGWYFTHVKGPGTEDETQNRFGPHAGAGLEFFLNRYWSIDSTYRYIWVEDIKSKDTALLDKTFRDQGYIITLAINHHF